MGEYAEKTKAGEKNGNEKRQFLQKQVRQSKRRNAVPKVIPRAIAQEFEQKTGYSSANIRVSESDMPDLFGAKAATQGNEIHFPRGKYRPETAEGRRILKHEMRHTIQQTRNEVAANVNGVVNNEKEKEAEADKGFEDIKMPRWNSYQTVSMGLSNSPVQCCGGDMSEEELKQYIIQQASTKAREVRTQQSKTKAGPCLSMVYDPLLKQFYFGQNFQSGNARENTAYQQWLSTEAHPIIQGRTDAYQRAIDSGQISNLPEGHDPRLAAHSEVRALDQALKAREATLEGTVDESAISEMYLYNINLPRLYERDKIAFKRRCENCAMITQGIKVLGDE